jgi:hypothetical protein
MKPAGAIDATGGGRPSKQPSDDPDIIAEWPLNRREHLRVSLQQYRGVDLVGVRKWFFGDDDSLCPGKDGITLNIKHLPQLADAITKALAEARARGLVAHMGEGAPS